MFYKIFDIITIGIPFGVFKVTSGLYYQFDLIYWWGLLDIAINIINIVIYLTFKRKILPTCSLAIIGHQFGKILKLDPTLTEDTGESFDVLFSFIIISLIIGSGAIAKYSSDMLRLWNISVILNVMGAGSIRLLQSFKRYKS